LCLSPKPVVMSDHGFELTLDRLGEAICGLGKNNFGG
jgi:hypothetical protein